MELFDEDGNAVVAFTQKEVDSKVKEAVTEAGTEAATKLKTSEDSLKEKTTELEGLSKKYDDKKNSYSELQKKTKEDEGKYKEVLERDTNAYNKGVEERIAKVAGEDKEYAEELKKQLDEGVGSETTDGEAIDKQIEKAQALTKIELSREVKSPMGGGGGAPDSPDGSEARFTDTQEGKDTFEVMNEMMGNQPEVTDDKN